MLLFRPISVVVSPKMPAPLPVTVVIINFQTPDLTSQAVRSLRRFYPEVPLLLVDNGSGDGSPRVLEELRQMEPAKTELLLNVTNLHHGPAMDQALRLLETPYVLFLDSDCVVERGGFLKAMLDLSAGEPRGYAVGKKIFMNDRGFEEIVKLGCDLVRVHLTPADFTDEAGNLVANQWLDMLGYLVARARENRVYVTLTFAPAARVDSSEATASTVTRRSKSMLPIVSWPDSMRE